MNTYEIEGMLYEAKNEYLAVMQAYKMADRIIMAGYLGNETWDYMAMFRSGKANVTVKRVC